MYEADGQRGGTGLALSGGGFRGVLFHLGGVWRLNELGWLARIDSFSGISGGSIVAAKIGLHWGELDFSADGVAGRFAELVADPIRRFCGLNVDLLPTLINGLLNIFGPPSNRLSGVYRRHLFGDARLSDLPTGNSAPRIIINACNLVSGSPVRFSSEGMEEDGVGRQGRREISLADAVASSSAYPPFLSPVVLDPKTVGGPLHDSGTVVLADGALVDPLGLATIWGDHRVLLVSDATTMLAHWPRPTSNWFRQLNRAILVQCDANSLQQRSHLLAAFESDDPQCSRRGAYWCNSSRISEYGQSATLAADTAVTDRLGRMRTRLNRFSPQEQGLLINWGYAMCDAALRSHGLATGPPGCLPVPGYPL